jgi:hypothetical protein
MAGLPGSRWGGVLGSAIGLGNLARYASGEARGWQDEVYIDHLQPWIIYGFLVLDANGNGRIDDISEMFGDRFQGGYAELAGYDSNHDGKISLGDLIWSELKVWQDREVLIGAALGVFGTHLQTVVGTRSFANDNKQRSPSFALAM